MSNAILHIDKLKDLWLNASMKTKILSQKELVEMSGLSYPEVSRILNKKRPVTVRQAKKLYDCTGITVERWLYPEDYPDNPYLRIKQ